jgi:hypothetical protein
MDRGHLVLYVCVKKRRRRRVKEQLQLATFLLFFCSMKYRTIIHRHRHPQGLTTAANLTHRPIHTQSFTPRRPPSSITYIPMQTCSSTSTTSGEDKKGKKTNATTISPKDYLTLLPDVAVVVISDYLRTRHFRYARKDLRNLSETSRCLRWTAKKVMGRRNV